MERESQKKIRERPSRWQLAATVPQRRAIYCSLPWRYGCLACAIIPIGRRVARELQGGMLKFIGCIQRPLTPYRALEESIIIDNA